MEAAWTEWLKDTAATWSKWKVVELHPWLNWMKLVLRHAPICSPHIMCRKRRGSRYPRVTKLNSLPKNSSPSLEIFTAYLHNSGSWIDQSYAGTSSNLTFQVTTSTANSFCRNTNSYPQRYFSVATSLQDCWIYHMRVPRGCRYR